MITGMRLAVQTNMPFGPVEASHIIPFAYASWDKSSNSRVEFTKAEDAQDLELPSAVFLDCHWRLAEMLNSSGMAEVIEKHLRDWEDIKGSTGGLLRQDGGTDIGRI